MKCSDMTQLYWWVRTIRTHGFPTGTMVYGPLTDESDVDFVMTEYDTRWFGRAAGLDVSMADCHKYALDFMSLKYRASGDMRVTNLIIVPDELAYQAWMHATQALSDLPPIPDKKERTFQFGRALNAFFLEHHSPDRAVWPNQKEEN